MRILTVSGSLRRNSSNSALLDAYATLAPAGFLEFSRFAALDSLPHFNPDLEDGSLSAEVLAMRDTVAEADVLVLSTPEYMHALPAVLKNFLEWLVGDPRFYQKSVAILHASSGSGFALESLREVLRTMSATILDDACVTIPLSGNRMTAQAILSNADFRRVLEGGLANLLHHARSGG